MAISPDGSLVAISGDDFDVHVRQTASGKIAAVIPMSIGVNHLTFSPNGEILAIANGDECAIWNCDKGSIVTNLNGHESTLHNVYFSASGRCLATLSNDMTVCLWDPNTGELHRTLFGFSKRPHRACFSSDGDTLVIGTEDGDISLWDVPSGQRLCTLATVSGSPQAISFRGDREILVLLNNDEGTGFIKSFRIE